MKLHELYEANEKETPASIEAAIDDAIEDEKHDLSNRHINWDTIKRDALVLAQRADTSPDGAVGKALRRYNSKSTQNTKPQAKKQDKKDWAHKTPTSAPKKSPVATVSKAADDLYKSGNKFIDFVTKSFKRGVSLDKKYK